MEKRHINRNNHDHLRNIFKQLSHLNDYEDLVIVQEYFPFCEKTKNIMRQLSRVLCCHYKA